MNAPTTLTGVIRGRRSIRRFQADPVARDVLAQLVEMASWAPSAGNRQDWFFTIVTSHGKKQELAELVRRRWKEIVAANRDCGFIEEVERYSARFSDFTGAPVVIVLSARKVDKAQEHMLGESAAATAGGAASAAMAAQNLMLAAHALGLGSCCMTGALAAREELGRVLGLPRKQEIVCLVALGRPAENPPAPGRKPVQEIARFVE